MNGNKSPQLLYLDSTSELCHGLTGEHQVFTFPAADHPLVVHGIYFFGHDEALTLRSAKETGRSEFNSAVKENLFFLDFRILFHVKKIP
jgi:hypothetical protein